jgi:hypothetical protein
VKQEVAWRFVRVSEAPRPVYWCLPHCQALRLNFAHVQNIHFTDDNCDKRHSKVDWFGLFELKLEKLQNVTNVTDGLGLVLANCRCWKGDTTMKKIGLIFATAFAFITGMAVVTVVAHTDRAMADSAGTVIVHPEQASKCDGTNC